MQVIPTATRFATFAVSCSTQMSAKGSKRDLPHNAQCYFIGLLNV